MPDQKGTHSMSFCAAIIGTGPSGFYAAEALLEARPQANIAMIERLPTPYGLVRYGVAPDHQKLKKVIRSYERIALDPRVRFFGNVEVGRHISIDHIRRIFDVVIVATGADDDRRLGIQGEDLPGSYSAKNFVGWYNGHPDFQNQRYDFSRATCAAIIGQGNVSMDIARILLKPPTELAKTDISEAALAALSSSRITDVHVIGRRGPVQAKFTSKELKEILDLPGVGLVFDPGQLDLGETCAAELADPGSDDLRALYELLRGHSSQRLTRFEKRLHLHFLKSPKKVVGVLTVKAVELEFNRLSGELFRQRAIGSGEHAFVPCDVLFRSVGFAVSSVDQTIRDNCGENIRNKDGRIVDDRQAPLHGLYVTGWARRGANGVIGTNRADAAETIAVILQDFGETDPGITSDGPQVLAEHLRCNGVQPVAFDDWLRLDRFEVSLGRKDGRVRTKISSIDRMMAVMSDGSVADTQNALQKLGA